MFIKATILTLYQMKQFTKVDIRIGTEYDNLQIWSYSAFSDLENLPIPPECYNALDVSVIPRI